MYRRWTEFLRGICVTEVSQKSEVRLVEPARGILFHRCSTEVGGNTVKLQLLCTNRPPRENCLLSTAPVCDGFSLAVDHRRSWGFRKER